MVNESQQKYIMEAMSEVYKNNKELCYNKCSNIAKYVTKAIEAEWYDELSEWYGVFVYYFKGNDINVLASDSVSFFSNMSKVNQTLCWVSMKKMGDYIVGSWFDVSEGE